MGDFRHYSFFKKYSNGYASSRSHVGKIKFVSYDRLGHHLLEVTPESDYVIYDHQVFETCVPGLLLEVGSKHPQKKHIKNFTVCIPAIPPIGRFLRRHSILDLKRHQND